MQPMRITFVVKRVGGSYTFTEEVHCLPSDLPEGRTLQFVAFGPRYNNNGEVLHEELSEVIGTYTWKPAHD